MKQILITEDMIFNEDHFEFTEGLPGGNPSRFGSENHADTGFGQANESISGTIGGVLGGFLGQSDAGKKSGAETGGKIGDAISGLFGGGKKEDTSLTGLNNFYKTFPGLPFYPTKDEMLNAAQVGKWESVEPAAIQASYNPQTGQWVRGDWHFQVIGTSPITVKDFKGANETHTFSAPVNAKGSGQQVLSPSGALAGADIGMVKATPTPNPLLTMAQQELVKLLPSGTTNAQASQALAQAGMPTNQTPFTGAASAGGFSQSLFGGMSSGMTIGISLGFLALVALIIWMANR